MSRPESIAVGGYFPTPEKLLPKIADLIKCQGVDEEGVCEGDFAIVDPCAGEGFAIVELAKCLFPDEKVIRSNVKLFACEMEESRHAILDERRRKVFGYSGSHTVHGDAFRLTWSRKSSYAEYQGANLLFLNPPYDPDPEFGRLEEKFLSRFTEALGEDGVLVFVVPFYVLGASAETIGKFYSNVSCFRFPEGDFEVFRQVVLVATKRTLPGADPDVVAQVRSWSKDSASIPVLGSTKRKAATISAGEWGLGGWVISPLDVKALCAKYRPWHASDKGGRMSPIQGTVPFTPVDDLLTRTYPMAMPPRAAHIAAGIAAGVFNGARILPDDPNSGLPPLLVKGSFDREFKTVEEKKNKEGEVTGKVQIQQPKLVVTVLDLRAKTYHTMVSSAQTTKTMEVGEMTTADLLTRYGRGLMKVMLDQCPVLHDPNRAADNFDLPEMARTPYQAQQHCIRASVKLLGGVQATKNQRQGKAVFVLGEVGSGKSTVALATAKTIKARRTLVLCPPHLLDGWKEQIEAVTPEAKAVVLSSVEDVDALAADPSEAIVAILSRETAKLGHSWEGVSSTCPKCGEPVPAGDLAKTRARCTATRLFARDATAKLTKELSLRLLPVSKQPSVLHGRHINRIRDAEKDPAKWPTVQAKLSALYDRVFSLEMDENRFDALVWFLLAIGDDALLADAARKLTQASTDSYSNHHYQARRLALLMEPGSSLQTELETELRATAPSRPTYYGGYGSQSPTYEWDRWAEARNELAKGEGDHKQYQYRDIKAVDGVLFYKDAEKGSVVAAERAVSRLSTLSQWGTSRVCDEFLYQAVPSPRRFPLATYIAKRYPHLLDFLVLDEGHEYSGDGSAQGFAAHRLTGLGIPTMHMTGSGMNGYAESMFANQWALDPEFRKEFNRDQRQEFVRRYGYLKQLVEEKERKEDPRLSYGSVTDRVETTSRTIGSAPGVLPLFLLRYVLRMSVTIHKSDLALDLPKRHDIVEFVEPSSDQTKNMQELQGALVRAIRKDMFGERAGKLWGQMAELPSYLDRATQDVGNGVDAHKYVVAYPESENHEWVASVDLFPLDTILPKEEWMLAKVRSELAEGRNVIVFSWHTALMPRLARLIEKHTGEKVAVLDANKVAAGKRHAWINKEVVKKERRVLVVNPVAVQTGLNNLVWFSTQIWMENPGCNAIVFRQATGRIDRIGQKKETRIFFPVYRGTTQESLHKLLLHKVGVSMATDGLDAESALQAAGVGETDGFSTLAVGKQIYEMLQAAA